MYIINIGKHSRDPRSDDYAPSIFTYSNISTNKRQQRSERYKRAVRRANQKQYLSGRPTSEERIMYGDSEVVPETNRSEKEDRG